MSSDLSTRLQLPKKKKHYFLGDIWNMPVKTKVRLNIQIKETTWSLGFYRASYASAVYAVIVCVSVRPSIRLSVRRKSELYKYG